MNKFAVTLTTTLLVASAMCGKFEYTACPGYTQQLANITTFKVSGTIAAGKTVYIEVDGDVLMDADVSTVYMNVSYLGYTFFKGNIPVGVTLHEKKGPLAERVRVNIPSLTPPGEFKIRTYLIDDATKKQVQCADVVVNL